MSAPAQAPATRARVAALLAPALLAAGSCGGEGATRIFVPGEGFAESIDVATEQGRDADVEVGEPLVLHVSRRSGPWVEVDASLVEEGACRLERAPEREELEVADELAWSAEPAEGPTFEEGPSADHTRTVRFERPGVYALTATGDSWCSGSISGAPVTVHVGGADVVMDHVEEAWTGDLDGIVERGFVRILTVHNPLYFSFDGREERGLAIELGRLFQEHLAGEIGRVRSPTVVLVPVPRDGLISGLLEGRGDVAAANLTITPGRERQVAFGEPLYPDVDELVVSGPAAPGVSTFDDLVATGLHLRRSSSYFEHVEALNAERSRKGLPAIPVEPADEHLEDHDLLDLVNAGVLPAIVVDSHKAAFWAPSFPDIVVHRDLAVARGGRVAWAVRPSSPRLLASIDAFARTVRKGTLPGNMLLKSYGASTEWIDAAVAGRHHERFQAVAEQFRLRGAEYGFDWIMLAAQGYQESRFDQAKRSKAGATGIMQPLPSTAADPVVGIPDVSTVEDNIHAGVKYLAWLRDRYFSDASIEPLDRVLFTFAAYNAGPASVARARRKAGTLGFDPDRWFGHVEVGMYRAVGGEPVTYVRNIYKYYVTYKRLVEMGRARERALRLEGGE